MPEAATLYELIAKVKFIKNQIKEVLESNDIDMAGVPFEGYPGKITSVAQPQSKILSVFPITLGILNQKYIDENSLILGPIQQEVIEGITSFSVVLNDGKYQQGE